MKKKNFLCIVISVLLIISLSSCGGSSKSLLEYGTEVISLMREMVENGEYAKFYNIPAAYDETVKALRNGDYSKASVVYELSVSASKLIGIDIDESELSDELYSYICSSSYISFSSLINQKSGSDALAVSAIFSAQKTFACKDIEENKVYLYVFENGYPIVITFVPGEDGSVRAIGNFVINADFAVDDAEKIESSCESMGIAGVEAIEK